MTPQELKNSILQLAIQGKLVEQRAEEGTAEELYQQIQEEKQRLIAEKKIKKEKPLPEITDDEKPFDIPDSWKWVRISALGITKTGNTPSKTHSEYQGNAIPFVTPADILDGRICYENQSLSEIGMQVARVCEFKSVLQVCIGGSIGKAAITEKRVAFNQQINAITPIFCNNKYVYYVMISSYFNKIMREKAGGTATPIINRGIWDTLLVPLPPLAEQKRIVERIEQILPYIHQYENAWGKLETFNKRFPDDMKKSLLQYAIEGKLVEQRTEEGTAEELYQQIQEEKQRLIAEKKIKKEKPLPEITEDEIPFDIPDSWKWVRLGELGNYKKGPFGSALTKSMFVPKGDGTIKVYEQKNAIQKDANIGEYYIDRSYFESKMTGFEVVSGDIIVSCVGTIGETFILPENIEQGIINQALMRMRIFNPIFIPYFLIFFDVVLKQNAIANSKGSAIKNIPPFDVLKNYLVPLPPLAEQKRIVEKLEQMLPLCESGL